MIISYEFKLRTKILNFIFILLINNGNFNHQNRFILFEIFFDFKSQINTLINIIFFNKLSLKVKKQYLRNKKYIFNKYN